MSATLVTQPTKISVYRNGDRNYFGKSFVVGRRQMSDMGRLLDSITTDIGLIDAARYLCTPVGGTRINAVEELQHAHTYVAVSKGRFKKLPYLNLEAERAEWLKQCGRRRQMNVNSTKRRTDTNSGNEVQERITRPKRNGVSVFVYSNGSMYEPARRILLTDHVWMLPLKYIIAEISESLAASFGAVRRLYAMDGTRIAHRDDLTPNGHYVAVGYTAFQPLNYGTVKPHFAVPSKVRPIEVEQKHGSVSEDSDILNDAPRTKHAAETKRRRLPPLIYPNGQSVFPVKPVRHRRKNTKRKPAGETTEGDGSYFRAPSEREETKNAEEVDETPRSDLQVDDLDEHNITEEVDESANTYPAQSDRFVDVGQEEEQEQEQEQNYQDENEESAEVAPSDVQPASGETAETAPPSDRQENDDDQRLHAEEDGEDDEEREQGDVEDDGQLTTTRGDVASPSADRQENDERQESTPNLESREDHQTGAGEGTDERVASRDQEETH